MDNLHTERMTAPRLDPGFRNIRFAFRRTITSMLNAIARGDETKAHLYAKKAGHRANLMLNARDKMHVASRKWRKDHPKENRLLMLRFAGDRAERRRLGIGDETGRVIKKGRVEHKRGS